MKKIFSFFSVITISITHFVHDIYTSFLAPLLPLLIEKFDISLKMASLLSIVRNIPSLLNPLFGLMADKVSLRYFIIIAPSISAITMSLLGSAPNYSILLLLLFITGIGSALFHVSAPVMIKQVSGEKRGLGMSFFRSIIKSSLTLYLPTYLTKSGSSLMSAGIALSIFQFSGATGTFLSGHFSDKIGRKNMLLLLSIMVPPLSFGFLLTSGIIKMLFLIALGLFIFGSTPVFLALVHDQKSSRPSFINGLYMAANFIVSSLSVLIIGTLGDTFGLKKTFLLAASLSILSIPFAMMVKNNKMEHADS